MFIKRYAAITYHEHNAICIYLYYISKSIFIYTSIYIFYVDVYIYEYHISISICVVIKSVIHRITSDC